jgi:hypothetical protein
MARMAGGGRTIVGIVGLTPVVEAYPLGPRLEAELAAELAPWPQIAVENMSWSPLHIVQRFEDANTTPTAPIARVVLVGAASASTSPGTVAAFRWGGGRTPDAVLQERIYEAVTGIVDIENTLLIGDHFGVWPAECFTVEADLPADAFGRIVIADSQGWSDEPSLAHHLGFSPRAVRRALVETAVALARDGAASHVPLSDKTAAGCASVTSFLRNVAV